MPNPTRDFGFSHHRFIDTCQTLCRFNFSMSILPYDDPFRKLHPSSLDTADSKHQKVAETSLYAWRTGDAQQQCSMGAYFALIEKWRSRLLVLSALM